MVVVVRVTVMVVVVMRGVLVDYTLDMAKLLHVAGDINRTVVLESVLLLGVFQKLQEQRVVDVDDGDYEALLLLLPLAHHNRQASFRYAPQILLLLHVMNVENISATHLDRKILFQRKIKEEKSEFEIDLEVAGRELIKWMKKSMEKDRAGLQGEDDERERPRIGSGDGEIEEGERRIGKRLWNVAHDLSKLQLFCNCI